MSRCSLEATGFGVVLRKESIPCRDLPRSLPASLAPQLPLFASGPSALPLIRPDSPNPLA